MKTQQAHQTSRPSIVPGPVQPDYGQIVRQAYGFASFDGGRQHVAFFGPKDASWDSSALVPGSVLQKIRDRDGQHPWGLGALDYSPTINAARKVLERGGEHIIVTKRGGEVSVPPAVANFTSWLLSQR